VHTPWLKWDKWHGKEENKTGATAIADTRGTFNGYSPARHYFL
jgi:hypothetical protein